MDNLICSEVVKFAKSSAQFELPEMPEFDYEAVRQFALDGWKLDEVHGMPHWSRVERHATILSLEVRNGKLTFRNDVNVKVVRLFAYFHDKCRVSNSFDMGHGPRAAKMLPSLRNNLLKDLSDEEFDLLRDACLYHTAKSSTGVPTIDVCLDADRLDLRRIGLDPDPKLMASPFGSYYAAHMTEFDLLMERVAHLRDFIQQKQK